eukprot:180026-Pyramimonas_sp.AAC.1
MLGDFNARVQTRYGDDESSSVGPRTFRAISANPYGMAPEVWQNRQLLIEFANLNHLRLANAWFRKPDRKLAAYRAPGTQRGAPFHRRAYEQLDFIIAPRRWKQLYHKR